MTTTKLPIRVLEDRRPSNELLVAVSLHLRNAQIAVAAIGYVNRGGLNLLAERCLQFESLVWRQSFTLVTPAVLTLRADECERWRSATHNEAVALYPEGRITWRSVDRQDARLTVEPECQPSPLAVERWALYLQIENVRVQEGLSRCR